MGRFVGCRGSSLNYLAWQWIRWCEPSKTGEEWVGPGARLVMEKSMPLGMKNIKG